MRYAIIQRPNTIAFDEGYDAWLAGKPRSANPYNPDDPAEDEDHLDWNEGWEFGDGDQDDGA